MKEQGKDDGEPKIEDELPQLKEFNGKKSQLVIKEGLDVDEDEQPSCKKY